MANSDHDRDFTRLAKLLFMGRPQQCAWYDVGTERQFDYKLVWFQTDCPEILPNQQDPFTLPSENRVVYLRENPNYARKGLERLFRTKGYHLVVPFPKRVPGGLFTGFGGAGLSTVVAYNGSNVEVGWFDVDTKEFVGEEALRGEFEREGFRFSPLPPELRNSPIYPPSEKVLAAGV